MSTIKCHTKNLEEATRCIAQLHNLAMVPSFAVTSRVAERRMLFDVDRLSAWATEAAATEKHLFGGNQTLSYEISAATLPADKRIELEFEVNFMALEKAVNDLRVTCGRIAEGLLRRLKPEASFAEKILAVSRFFKRYFKYQNTGDREAHSAVELLRSGKGVCQAIAGMATVILPFMGVPCLYVGGEGFSGTEWGPHGWNALKSPAGEWVFVDFTFGLQSVFFPPSTVNGFAEKLFRNSHRWNEAHHSAETFEASLNQLQRLTATRFELIPGQERFSMDGIGVSAGRQLLCKNKGRFGIDLVFLFRLLGGGVEYIPERDRLHFVLSDRQFYLEAASGYMNRDGTFNVCILKALPVRYALKNNGMILRLA